MIGYQTTRDRTDYPNYLTSVTSSNSFSNSGFTAYGYDTSYISISEGKTLNASIFQRYATESHSDPSFGGWNASSSAEGAGTFYTDATMGSVSQSFASTTYFNGTNSAGATTSTVFITATDSSSTQFSGGLSDTIFTIQNSGYTYGRTTTADVPYTSTHYIISGSGSRSVLTTDSTALTAVGTTTDEGTATSWSIVSTTSTFSTYYDLGGIYSADTDWIWKIENTNTTPQLVSDIGASADAVTIWPIGITREQSIFPVTDSSLFTGTFAIPADTSRLDYQGLFSTTTSSSTIPSGDSVSFDTASTAVTVWTTDTVSTVVGNNEASTVTAATTASYTAHTWRVDTYNATVTYPYGLDISTTDLVQLTSFFDLTTLFSISPAYLVSSSSMTTGEGSAGYSEMGQTVQGTDLFYQGFNIINWGGTAYGINPIAPVYAFVAPTDLRSDGNPYNFTPNLDFGSTRIPYPNFAQVFSNAYTPSPTGFTTTGTNGHSFSYSWIADTLKYTEYSTHTSGTFTLTDRTKSSGIFSASGPMSTFYADGGSVFGGYPAIPTAAESVYFQPRAVIGTSIDIGGASTTYRTLATDSAYSEISETAVIEQAIPAFIVFTQLQETPNGQSFFGYQRN